MKKIESDCMCDFYQEEIDKLFTLISKIVFAFLLVSGILIYQLITKGL